MRPYPDHTRIGEAANSRFARPQAAELCLCAMRCRVGCRNRCRCRGQISPHTEVILRCLVFRGCELSLSCPIEEGGFMRKLLLSLSSAGALVLAASASQAMPLSNAVDGLSSPPIVLTAGGCGIGSHRGPYGGCRPNGVWRGPYWRGPGWHYYHGCWRGPYGHVHCR